MRSTHLSPTLVLVVAVACASRAGYVEPGPLSANANPPPPSGLSASPALQTSRAFGSTNEAPPRLNVVGGEVREEHPAHPENPIPTECASDADCVPATCCHPAACVPSARAPACRDQVCSTECAPGTLDCNQSRCICAAGRCSTTRARGA